MDGAAWWFPGAGRTLEPRLGFSFVSSCIPTWALYGILSAEMGSAGTERACSLLFYYTTQLSKEILVFQKTTAIYPLTPCSCFAAAKVARAGYLFLSKVDNNANITTYIEITL